MALVTGLPNFFNAANPVASDFNNAAKAVLQQIGGTYYDEAASGYRLAGGNLDTTNLSANASLRNSQKAEPAAWFYLMTDGVGQSSLQIAVFPPLPVAASLYAIALSTVATTGGYVGLLGGSIGVYQNAILVNTFPFENRPVTISDSAYIHFELPCSPGDQIILDLSQVTFQGAGTKHITAALLGTTIQTR